MDLKNNSLEKEIEELQMICERLKDRNVTKFNPPASEEEILEWECINGITIPESYKEWLRFADSAQIMGHAAQLLGVKSMVVNNKHVPEDMVIIGHMVGDGEVLCFSKETGQIVSVFEGKSTEYKDFGEVLKELIDGGKSELGEDGAMDAFALAMLKVLEEKNKSGEELTKESEGVLERLQAKLKSKE